MAFNSSAAFSAATARRRGSNFVALQEFTPISPQTLAEFGEIAFIVSHGVRKEDGTDILAVQFWHADAFGGTADVKLDVPNGRSIDAKVGDLVSLKNILGDKQIQQSPTVAPKLVVGFSAVVPQEEADAFKSAMKSAYAVEPDKRKAYQAGIAAYQGVLNAKESEK